MSSTPTGNNQPTPPSIVHKNMPLWLKLGLAGFALIFTITQIYSWLKPSAPDPVADSESWGVWGWLTAIYLCALGGYCVFKYMQKSDGKTATKVGGYVVVGLAVVAGLALILTPTLFGQLAGAGMRAARTGGAALLDGSTGGGARECTIDVNLTRVGEQKQFTYSPGCKITVSSCTRGPSLPPAEYSKISQALNGKNPYDLMTHFGYEVRIKSGFDGALRQAGLQSIPVIFERIGGC